MIVKCKLLSLGVASLLLFLITACGNVGIYDPQATQIAFQETITALEATIVALETSNAIAQAQPTGQASPQIIVVTATPTLIQVSSLTASPMPSLTASPTIASQGETIVITPTATPVVTPSATSEAQPAPIPTATLNPPTPAATPAITPSPTFEPQPSPTPNITLNAPVITEPPNGAVIEEEQLILLHWSWDGRLGPAQHFDIKIRPDGETRSAYVAWEEAESHEFKVSLPPGRYFWSVQVIEGYYENDSGRPEDRVLEAFLSPESEAYLIIIAKKEPRETPTRAPSSTD